MRYLFWIIGIIFFLSGCATQSVAVAVSNKNEKHIALEDMQKQLSQQLPLKLKGDFGKVTLDSILIQEGEKSGSLSVAVHFTMVTFEIPEGIEGIVRYNVKLRYDPMAHTLYFIDLEPVSLKFGGDPTLREYISSGARRGVPSLIAGGLRSLIAYRFPLDFRAKKLLKATLKKDTLILNFK